MTTLTEHRLNELLKCIEGKTVAVVGDLMLDRYIWGSVTRVSPEAPVPVVDVETEQMRLGGAANVAQNIRSLGGKPVLIGVVGDDASGRQILQQMRDSRFAMEGVVVDPSRPTTVKTRIIAHSQHVVRIDRESRADISYTVQNSIVESLQRMIDSIDAVIIEDYNKGVVVTGLIRQIIDMANRHGRIITVDPKHNNFFEYRNVTVFKPNRKEVEEVLAVRLHDDAGAGEAARQIRARLNAANVLVTRGEHGMTLCGENDEVSHMQTKARTVADVSGAGDTVIAALTMSLAGGATMKEAATIANFAGGVVCGSVGIVPIDTAELKASVLRDLNHRGAPAEKA